MNNSKIAFLLYGMMLFKLLQPVLQIGELLPLHMRNAGPQSLRTIATRDGQRYGAYAIVYQLLNEVFAAELGV